MVQNIEDGKTFYRKHSYSDESDDFDLDFIYEYQDIGNTRYCISKDVSKVKDRNDIKISITTFNDLDFDNHEIGYEIQYSIKYDYINVIDVNKSKDHKKQNLIKLTGEEYYEGIEKVLSSFDENWSCLSEFSEQAKDIFEELVTKLEKVKQHAI